jgi:hypothetical protein
MLVMHDYLDHEVITLDSSKTRCRDDAFSFCEDSSIRAYITDITQLLQEKSLFDKDAQ